LRRKLVNIFHTSIPVQDPGRVAEALAKLFGGRKFNFLHPGCYFVTLGEPGALIELYRKPVVIQPGLEGLPCQLVDSPDPAPHTGAHTAVRIKADPSRVFQIASEYGWRAETHSRGVFHVIEFWIENQYMLEIFPPRFAAEYLAATASLPGPES